MFSSKDFQEGKRSDFFASLSALNTDSRLSEQYVTFTAARHDLCTTRPVPEKNCRLTVECMQYEGDCTWNFPLQDYIPKRDNHNVPDVQARRFWDNNVEFSEKVMPVGDIEAEIRIADFAGNPTWGYYPCVMRIGGWPFRLRKIGTFEGYGKNGHHELNIGLHYFEQDKLWNLLEGPASLAATGPGQTMAIQGNQRRGFKFYAMLTDLDWLGPNLNGKKHDDPEVPQEKGYVWFTVEETIEARATSPSSIGKAVRIKLLDEGIIPAWLDLHYLQVFAGGVPLGFFSQADVDPESEGTALEDGPQSYSVGGGTQSLGKVQDSGAVRFAAHPLLRSAALRLVAVQDPLEAQANDIVDMGWAIFDCCYKGATIRVGKHAGKWAEDAGADHGMVDFKASGPPPLCHGEYKDPAWPGHEEFADLGKVFMLPTLGFGDCASFCGCVYYQDRLAALMASETDFVDMFILCGKLGAKSVAIAKRPTTICPITCCHTSPQNWVVLHWDCGTMADPTGVDNTSADDLLMQMVGKAKVGEGEAGAAPEPAQGDDKENKENKDVGENKAETAETDGKSTADGKGPTPALPAPKVATMVIESDSDTEKGKAPAPAPPAAPPATPPAAAPPPPAAAAPAQEKENQELFIFGQRQRFGCAEEETEDQQLQLPAEYREGTSGGAQKSKCRRGCRAGNAESTQRQPVLRPVRPEDQI
eukprot:s689_g23.t1